MIEIIATTKGSISNLAVFPNRMKRIDIKSLFVHDNFSSGSGDVRGEMFYFSTDTLNIDLFYIIDYDCYYTCAINHRINISDLLYLCKDIHSLISDGMTVEEAVAFQTL